MRRCGVLYSFPPWRLLAPSRPLCTPPPKGQPAPREEGVRTYDLARGEIASKLQSTDRPPPPSPRPMNFEEARDLAQRALLEQREAAQRALGQQRAVLSQVLGQKWEDLRVIFGGQSDQPRTPEQEWYYKRVSFWMKRYENFVGLTEVKAAQARVVECEKKFIEIQEMRREAQKMISDVRKRIKDIHLELEKTHRGEDRYLVLVTQEHQVLKEEKNLLDEFTFYEKGERENFSHMSNAVRDSHEKERAQAEKTKYWSIIGSIIGTCIGIVGTTIINRMRMNELRRLVSQNSSVEEIQAIGAALTEDFSQHQADLARLVKEVQGVVGQAGGSLAQLDKVDELLQSLEQSSEKINTRLLDKTVAELQAEQHSLSQAISSHQSLLEEKMEGIQSDLFVQNKNVSQLSHITLKDREREGVEREERERGVARQLEALARQGAGLEQVLESGTRGIEEKMKDVRSLLLAEAQVPRPDSRWQENLELLQASQMDIMQEGFANIDKKISTANRVRLDTLQAITSNLETQGKKPELQLVELDTVVHLMERQQKRTQQTVLLSALTLVILAPVAVWALGNNI